MLAHFNQGDEIARFLRDVLTFEEIDEAIRRFEAARMLTKKATFRDIAKKTGMSSATIARINYWLEHGTGGYRLALRKLARR